MVLVMFTNAEIVVCWSNDTFRNPECKALKKVQGGAFKGRGRGVVLVTGDMSLMTKYVCYLITLCPIFTFVIFVHWGETESCVVFANL